MKLARVTNGAGFAAVQVDDAEVRLLEPWRQGDPMRTAFTLPEAGAAIHDTVPLDSVRFLPPLSLATKVICLGLNYRDHVAEAGQAEPPPNPSLFLKLPDALVGHDEPILRPRVSSDFDFEGEIAVVIGKGGRHIAKDDAMSHVYGFTILMDGSVRDYQGHSPTAGKCFHASSAVGPWIVTADAIDDYRSMTLRTRLNGQKVQSTDVSYMLYDIPTAIEYISRWTPLAPGDIISTGTPAGVGVVRKPPLWMKPGDAIEVEVGGVGLLRNRVADEG